MPEVVAPSSLDGSVDFGSVGSSEVGSSEDIGSVVGSFCSVDGRHARPTHDSVVDSPEVGSVDSFPSDSVVGISEGVLSSSDSVVSCSVLSVLSVSNGSVVPLVLAGPLVRSSVGCVVGGLVSVLKQFPSGPQESVVIVGKTSGVSVASFSSSFSSSSSSSLHGGFSAFSS